MGDYEKDSTNKGGYIIETSKLKPFWRGVARVMFEVGGLFLPQSGGAHKLTDQEKLVAQSYDPMIRRRK